VSDNTKTAEGRQIHVIHISKRIR